MRVQIYTPRVSGDGLEIAGAVLPMFKQLGSALSKDYGGPMDNLWIDVELYTHGINVPDKPPWTFRFQKRVSPRPIAGLPKLTSFNVGHYAVRPTATDLFGSTTAEVAKRVVALVYQSTALLSTQRQLSGFDCERFRADFRSSILGMGVDPECRSSHEPVEVIAPGNS